METIREEIVNGRKITYVRYTEEEKAAMKKRAEERKRKKQK